MNMSMLLPAVLIGLWAGVAGIDMYDGLLHIHRPLVTGPVVGLILGDFQMGLIVGATLELVWAGMVPLAGAQPPNVVIGGIMGTAFAIITHQDPKVAVGIAIPFAIAVQGLVTLLFTAYSPIMTKMDKYALEGDTKKIDLMNYIQPVILFVSYFIIAFLPIFFGAQEAKTMVDGVPAWILTGLSVAGSMMPAVGFAMLLKIMWKTIYAPFFIGGFILAAYGNMPILGVALVAIAIAFYDYQVMGSKNGNSHEKLVSNTEQPEEEDYSNGI